MPEPGDVIHFVYASNLRNPGISRHVRQKSAALERIGFTVEATNLGGRGALGVVFGETVRLVRHRGPFYVRIGRTTIALAVLLALARRPVTLEVNGYVDRHMPRWTGPLVRASLRFLGRRATVTVTGDRSWRPFVRRTFGPNARFVTLPLCPGQRQIPAAAETDRSVVFTGLLVPAQGLPDLVKAWDRAALSGWTLVLHGEGTYRAEVERVCRGRDDIVVRPLIRGDAYRSRLATAGVLVAPYAPDFHREDPRSLLKSVDYATTDRPMIVSDLDTILDDVDGDDLVFSWDRRSADSLAQVLVAAVTAAESGARAPSRWNRIDEARGPAALAERLRTVVRPTGGLGGSSDGADSMRRIVVHDLCGHPFQAQLARELARRGNRVLHLYSDAFETGKGDLDVPAELASTLRMESLDTKGEFTKYSLVGRVVSELRYGWRLVRRVRRFAPEVVLSANDPLIAKTLFALGRPRGVRWVSWQQDLISRAVATVAAPKRRIVRMLAVPGVRMLEQLTLRRADHIVCISPDFTTEIEQLGIPPGRCTVIENWAPLEEIAPAASGSTWAAEVGLENKRLVVYSGTLGLKHEPDHLAALARRLGQLGRIDDVVVVVSEGIGAAHLTELKGEQGLDQLVVLPFQPYERLGDVLNAAVVLVVLLEPDAGLMSVPSKVLSYLAAGRPILGAVPPENLASQTISDAGAGITVAPGDEERFVSAALELLDRSELELARLGRNGRDYAERTFDIEAITDRFEHVLFADRPA